MKFCEILLIILICILCALLICKYKQTNLKKMSLLTLNVQFYNEDKLATDPKKLADHILEYASPDIVCFQEDLKKTPNLGERWNKIYVKASSCQAEEHKQSDGYLVNTIYVRRRLLNAGIIITSLPSIYTTSTCPVPRCASAINISGINGINGITIVNTHLCGGRYDDAVFADTGPDSEDKVKTLMTAKTSSVRNIIDFYNPDIIVGDMNSLSNKAEIIDALNNHPVYLTLLTDRKNKFFHFFADYLDVLASNGFIATYGSDIGPTSKFGATIDHVFYKKSERVPNIMFNKVIPSIDSEITDHNGVLVDILL